MIPKQISKEDVWRCIEENKTVYYANPNEGTCCECVYEIINHIKFEISIPEVIFFVMIEQEDSKVYCDRNLCTQNEYNGIDCDECQEKRRERMKE